MIKLTPQEKLEKSQRNSLQALCNRIASAFNFGKIKTWADVYRMEGLEDSTIEKLHGIKAKMPCAFADLKVYFEERKQALEHQIVKAREVAVVVATKAPEPVVTPAPVVIPEQGKMFGSDNDYGLPPSPNEKAWLFWFQKKVVREMLDDVVDKLVTGQLLLSSTGTGKTFMAGGLVRRLVDKKFTDNKTFGATTYLYVTRASIVEKTKRDFATWFGLSIRDGVEILNIEQLRSRAGSVWIREKVVIENGEERTVYEWRKLLNPVVVLWDECQALKNEGSIQHQIACAFNDIPSVTHQIFISATPFTRVSEAKCFAVSTHKDLTYINGVRSSFPEGAKLSNTTWPTYASIIAYPSDPTEYNEAAVERLVKDLDPYIKRVKGVRPQFDADNSIKMIQFETLEERKYYEDTEARYIRKKAKLQQDIDAGVISGGGIWPLVLLNERCMAAELCRKEHIARRMHQATVDGYAAVCAAKYKATIIAVVKILVEKYGVPRSLISLVWGGGQTQLTKKQKTKQDIQAKAAALEAAGMSATEVLESLDLEDVEDRVIEELDPSLKLGPQSLEERQSEIDKFQSGKTLYCLYTFKAGGVGLSLHHSDEFTKQKCRRKPSGYVVEEDIPLIPVRPRKNIVAPTYSAMELVQGLGRCPRLTSLSRTPQELLFYSSTVETDVARIVAQKLRCLTRVVRMRETWQDVVLGGGCKVEEHINNTEGLQDNPDDLIGGEEEEE